MLCIRRDRPPRRAPPMPLLRRARFSGDLVRRGAIGCTHRSSRTLTKDHPREEHPCRRLNQTPGVRESREVEDGGSQARLVVELELRRPVPPRLLATFLLFVQIDSRHSIEMIRSQPEHWQYSSKLVSSMPRSREAAHSHSMMRPDDSGRDAGPHDEHLTSDMAISILMNGEGRPTPVGWRFQSPQNYLRDLPDMATRARGKNNFQSMVSW